MTLPPDTAALVEQDQTRLLHMGPMPDGGFGMELEGGPIPAIGEYLANMLGMRTDTPSNYVQMDIHRADLGWMTLTLQRQSGKTPHQLRVEAETKLSEAAATIEAQARRIAELREALKPFAKAGEVAGPSDPRWDFYAYRPAAGDEYAIMGNHLRAATACLARANGARDQALPDTGSQA